jgi:protein-glucosylgalactosylhydroxylysine glucosidase
MGSMIGENNLRMIHRVRLIVRYSLILAVAAFVVCGCSPDVETGRINREQLVTRHQVKVYGIDTLTSLTVGNGQFAFTVDFTGLQSFPELYEKGIPLGTQSEWGWHSFPNEKNYSFDESLKNYKSHGREIPYAVQWPSGRNQDAANYFRQNPHRLHLGIVGLDFFRPNGSVVAAEEIKSINQVLNPWNGEIKSSFEIDGVPVTVTTFAHQELDLISTQIESPLVERGLLRVKLKFPYPTGQHSDSGCDWNQPDKHSSSLKDGETIIHRQLDETSYYVQLSWGGAANFYEEDRHHFYLVPEKNSGQFWFSCHFAEESDPIVFPDFKATADNSRLAWRGFWENGGAVDFSGSTDPRAFELERRIILSQYLTKIQCAGNYPSQETGLTYNSWYGKFHLEMHWWHAVHFALWDRTHLVEKSLDWYNKTTHKAKENAQRQGFEGIRWLKMTDPWGNDSPSGVGSFLIWQQPHVIYLAELCYRNTPNEETLNRYVDLVFATADFMASYAWYDSTRDRYILGPPLIPAQERLPAETTINPPFELTYWYWGLTKARQWRERLKLEREPKWDAVINGLSKLAQQDGLYLAAESAPDSYTNPRFMGDHPMVLGVFGMLPGSPLLDTAIMARTFDHIWQVWHWQHTWGWDFPMTAMAATRLGMPDKALDALFMDIQKNTYLPNGHNYQDQRLRLYLPGNGALLTAVAMMCAGYEGSDKDIPGFPNDGSWQVKWEGLQKIF